MVLTLQPTGLTVPQLTDPASGNWFTGQGAYAGAGLPADLTLLNGLLSDRVYNVKSPGFGAKGDGVTDDTAAIQAAINDAAADSANLVILPPGVYVVSTLTIPSNLTLIGAGPPNTTLLPNTAGVNVINASTASNYRLRDFQIGQDAQSVAPLRALYLANSGSNSRAFLSNIWATGQYTTATAQIDIGWGSAIGCIFYNFIAAGVPTISMTNAINWTFVGCELHDWTQSTSTTPLSITGGGRILWLGGSLAVRTNAPYYVGLFTSPSHVTFQNTYFYGDNGPAEPPSMIFVAAPGASDIAVKQCSCQGPGTGYVFLGAATANMNLFVYEGIVEAPNVVGVVGPLVGNVFTLTTPTIHCSGLPINVGGSGTIAGGLLIDPGTVTAGTDTSTKITSAGNVIAGGNVQATGTISGAGGTSSQTSGDFVIGRDVQVGQNLILTNTTSTLTIGAAGAASALPATPSGYVLIAVNGTNYKFPVYNP